MSQSPEDPDEFPLPFAVTGVKPKLRDPDTQPAPRSRSSAQTRTDRAPVQSPAPGGTAKSGSPEDPGKATDDPKVKDASKATKKVAKPLVLDPKLLERALQNRNANH
jgi:hypothetical protein